MIITIDGPVAAGKTTAARRLAARLGLPLLDTGAIYRCVALAARRQNLDWHDEPAVAQVAVDLRLRFTDMRGTQQVRLDGFDVSEPIRHPKISEGASIVSAHPGVRAALLAVQRRQAEAGDLIAEGRDTGTVVFPAAEWKFFLTAAVQVRAQRRLLELHGKGVSTDLPNVLQEIRARDHRDSTRELAPLVPASEAITIDSTRLSIEQVVARMADSVLDLQSQRDS